MDQTKHKQLSVGQLVEDSRFVNAVLATGKASTAYLQKLNDDYPNQRHIIQAACQAILQLQAHYQSQSPSEELKQRMLNRIRSK